VIYSNKRSATVGSFWMEKNKHPEELGENFFDIRLNRKTVHNIQIDSL